MITFVLSHDNIRVITFVLSPYLQDPIIFFYVSSRYLQDPIISFCVSSRYLQDPIIFFCVPSRYLQDPIIFFCVSSRYLQDPIIFIFNCYITGGLYFQPASSSFSDFIFILSLHLQSVTSSSICHFIFNLSQDGAQAVSQRV